MCYLEPHVNPQNYTPVHQPVHIGAIPADILHRQRRHIEFFMDEKAALGSSATEVMSGKPIAEGTGMQPSHTCHKIRKQDDWKHMRYKMTSR